MKLILIRHGETDWNRDHRVQGHADVELSELGRKQAESIAEALEKEPISAVYSSTLRRAQDTALAIARRHQLEVETDPDLKEVDAGDLDGLTIAEMRARYSEFLSQWRRNPVGLNMPGGESLEELQQRAWAAIQRIYGRHEGDTVVVVSHNFAIQTIICRALHMELSQFRRLRQETAGITILDMGPEHNRLVVFNDTCHLNKEASF